VDGQRESRLHGSNGKVPVSESMRRPENAAISQNERDNGEHDKDDYEPFGDFHTETGDSSDTKHGSDNCQNQEKDREFDEISPGLQRE
jgi:hypothetical protein